MCAKKSRAFGGFCALEEEILLAHPLQFLGLANGLGCAGEEYTRRTQVQKPDSIDHLSITVSSAVISQQNRRARLSKMAQKGKRAGRKEVKLSEDRLGSARGLVRCAHSSTTPGLVS